MLKRMVCILSGAFIIMGMLAGCWDKVEIDQRGFVSSILLDEAPPGYQEKVAESTKGIPGTEVQVGKPIKVTLVFPNTSVLAAEGGGGGNEMGHIALSSIATDIAKANRYIDARISRTMFFGHTQMAVFSEAILKDPEKVKEIVDHLARAPLYNRTMKVLMVEGEASKLGELKPKGELLMFRYILGILQNGVTNGRIIDVDLNEFITRLDHPEDVTILPRMVVEPDEVKIGGVGLIKDFKLIGYLSEYDALYFNTLTGNRLGGRETINVGDLMVDFATDNSVRRVELVNSDPQNLEVVIGVKIEGTLMSGVFGEDLFDNQTIKRIEQGLNEMSEDSCKFVISKLQKEYNADALEIADYLRKFHPEVWDTVKDRWDEVFPNIKIVPQIDHKIRRIGTVK